MAYGTPTDPVGGTVITVAYAVANILDPIRWLRLLTGNADPPGSNYVIVSTGTAGANWQKVPADALASGAVVAHLGYTPANKAGDSFSGTVSILGATSDLNVSRNIVAGGAIAAVGGLQGATATIFGALSAASVSSGGAIASSAGLSGTTGTFSGALSALSATITNAISAASASLTGALSAASAVFTGLVQASRFESTVATGTAPLTVASTTEVANLNAAALSGADWTAASTGTFISASQALTTTMADLSGASWTAPRTGTYLLVAAAEFGTTSTDGPVEVGINVNGSQVALGIGAGGINMSFDQVTALYVGTITAGHTVKAQARKQSGSGGAAIYYARIVGVWTAP